MIFFLQKVACLVILHRPLLMVRHVKFSSQVSPGSVTRRMFTTRAVSLVLSIRQTIQVCCFESIDTLQECLNKQELLFFWNHSFFFLFFVFLLLFLFQLFVLYCFFCYVCFMCVLCRMLPLFLDCVLMLVLSIGKLEGYFVFFIFVQCHINI